MRTNPVKQALAEGRTAIGSEISRLGLPDVVRLFAGAGFDFAFIDMEHTALGLETVAGLVQAARASGIVPLVRVPQAEYAFVARVLDGGAMGVIVPRVNTPQQVHDVLAWMRHPPRGIRGYACTAAATDGQTVAPEEFLHNALTETLCVIQIERQQALEHLDEMLAIEGVNVACLGYMDLSVDLGIPGQLKHPRMIRAIEQLIESAERHGCAAGIICPDMAAVEHWMQRGMRFVSYATDALLLHSAAVSAAQHLRAAAAAIEASTEEEPHGVVRRGVA